MQIVPFLAALLYRLFGIHEIFGRLISIGFGLGTVVLAGAFARRLFASRLAGCVAALAFAIYPGSVYYGRTFMPDTAMTFFLTAAIYAASRWIDGGAGGENPRFGRRFWIAALLAAAAVLAKPVAVVALVPIAAMLAERRGRAFLRDPETYVFAALALGPYVLYDGYLRTIAEWHWASGITRLHVLPALLAAFSSPGAFLAKGVAFAGALRLLAATMLGPVGFLFLIAALVLRAPARSRTVLWAWLTAGLAYAYVVVTVERVDYYLYPLLPLAAIWTGGLAEAVRRLLPAGTARRAALGALVAIAIVAIVSGRAAVAKYYLYSRSVYRQATALNRTLPHGTLVVMGHYDPSVLYYINRKGWEEDPYLWTPFDEESAIRKGARAFIAIEANRLARNVELSAWLERFPRSDVSNGWPVYLTDPANVLPDAEARWRAFRKREKARGRS